MAIAMAAASDIVTAVAATSPLIDVNHNRIPALSLSDNSNPTTSHHPLSGGSAGKQSLHHVIRF